MTVQNTVPIPEPEREPSLAEVAAAYTGEIPLGQPEPVHYDPDRLDRLSPCNLNLDDVAAQFRSTNPAAVTCALCAATLVDGQLAEPDAACQDPCCAGRTIPWPDALNPHRVADGPRFERIATERLAQLVDEPAVDPVENLGELAPPPAERRTVGLEVLTPELRAEFGKTSDDPIWGGAVAVVLRVNGEVVDVPEIDTLWVAPYRKPADVLAKMLTQARMYADGGIEGEIRGELLMPTPDVLAVLAGQPELQAWTAPVDLCVDQIRKGWLVVGYSTNEGEELVDSVSSDCKDGTCPWEGDCTVLAIGGTEPTHFADWQKLTVRIPAAVR